MIRTFTCVVQTYLKVWVMTWNLCRIDLSQSILRGRCGTCTVNYHILSPGFKFNELKAFPRGEICQESCWHCWHSREKGFAVRRPHKHHICPASVYNTIELLPGSNFTSDLPRWWGPFLGGSESAKECNFGGGLDLHGSLRCHVH